MRCYCMKRGKAEILRKSTNLRSPSEQSRGTTNAEGKELQQELRFHAYHLYVGSFILR